MAQQLKNQGEWGGTDEAKAPEVHFTAAAHDKIKYRDMLNRIVALGIQRSRGRLSE